VRLARCLKKVLRGHIGWGLVAGVASWRKVGLGPVGQKRITPPGGFEALGRCSRNALEEAIGELVAPILGGQTPLQPPIGKGIESAVKGQTRAITSTTEGLLKRIRPGTWGDCFISRQPATFLGHCERDAIPA